jgi:hypothetical protein
MERGGGGGTLALPVRPKAATEGRKRRKRRKEDRKEGMKERRNEEE